jgi:hypothetical protein
MRCAFVEVNAQSRCQLDAAIVKTLSLMLFFPSAMHSSQSKKNVGHWKITRGDAVNETASAGF